MSERLLVDTNVLIDYSRGRREAVEYLESLETPPMISAITVAELYGGVREGVERKDLDELVERLTVIQINGEIAQAGGLYRRDYFRSYGVGLADAIIAATAESVNATMVTLNKKHFPMLSTVFVPYVRTQ
jgi:predicted nucleic acid-binding protein